jgi:hypothetical protein
LVLLIALLGAILLTMQSQSVIRQEAYQQISRNSKNAIFVIDLKQ